MSAQDLFFRILLLLISFSLIGCSANYISSNTNPIDPIFNTNQKDMLAIDVESNTGLGIFGLYELAIDPESSSVELHNKRNLLIGESYLVSGTPFFTNTPCSDCLRLKSLRLLLEGYIAITFNVKHPFDKGNPSQDPSAINRLDLDVFDLAAIIVPKGKTPTTFPIDSMEIHDSICANADAYTQELSAVLQNDILYPYVLVKDESEAPSLPFKNNRFEMGSEDDLEIWFILEPASTLRFDLYLTMGYGASAKKNERLSPKYYVPEFNRKSAWKVVAEPPQGANPPHAGNTWNANDSSIPYDVKVMVYDWQINAVVYSDPVSFKDAPPDNIYAPSGVKSVGVQIMGMTTDWIETSTATSGDGNPDNPLLFNIPVRNENLLPDGEYPGLVYVEDEREVGDPSTDTRDFLIHTPDGVQLINLPLPSFKTYQIFTATVVPGGVQGDGWAVTWDALGGEGQSSTVDNSGNIYITGLFYGTRDFDPGSGVTQYSSNGTSDVFVSKFNSEGTFLWCRTWGGSLGLGDSGWAITTDNPGNVLIAGYFSGTVDFDPTSGVHQHTSINSSDSFVSKFDSNGNFQWAITWAGYCTPFLEFSSIDLVSDNTGVIWIIGQFMDSIDIDPGPGTVMITSNGAQDIHLLRVNSNGDYMNAWVWGGGSSEIALVITVDNSGNIICGGGFGSSGLDFDPGTGTNYQPRYGELDSWISKFNSSGIFQWAATWGSPTMDVVQGIDSDNSDNIYCTGYFTGTVDFDPGTGVSQKNSVGMKDVYASKLNSNAALQWVKTWGGTSNDEGRSICVDGSGNVYTAGGFCSSVDFNPDPIGVDQHNSSGWIDIFLSKLDQNGDYLWARSWGAVDTDLCQSVNCTSDGTTYLSGQFDGTVDFDPGSGVDEHTGIPGMGVFLMKLLPNGYWY